MSNQQNHQRRHSSSHQYDYPSGFYAAGSAATVPVAAPQPYGTPEMQSIPYNYGNMSHQPAPSGPSYPNNNPHSYRQNNPHSNSRAASQFSHPKRGRVAPHSMYHGAAPRGYQSRPQQCPPPSNWNQQRHVTQPSSSSPPHRAPPPPPPPPRRQEWKCDTCNHTVDSKAALEAHTASHIQCTACSFSAAPKIVKAHYQAAHGKFSKSGFKTITVAVPGCPVQRFRICIGNNPEDIQKWIAERKRRFPRSSTKPAEKQEELVENKEEDTKTKQAGDGLMGLLDGYGSSSSEEEDDDGETPTVTSTAEMNKRPKVSKDTERNDSESKPVTANEPENSTDAPTTAAPAPVERNSNYRTKPCRFFVRNGSCRNGDACRFRHDLPTEDTVPAGAKRAAPANNASSSSQHRNQRRKKTNSSLLEKLLRSDAQRESILTLQLIDYIVENDFFSRRDGKISGDDGTSS